MTDLPGSAAIGIEGVEWLPEGAGNLTVRVTGRWRRRRPAAGGQATLVIEAEGRRHRFPALPEPPSLTGAGPGMWQLRFSVPGSLAPDLGGRTWLQFGTVIVPLPAAVAPPGDRSPAELEDEPRPEAPRHEPFAEPAESPAAAAAAPPIPEPEKAGDVGSAGAGPSFATVARETERLRLERDLLERRTRSRGRIPAEPTAPHGRGRIPIAPAAPQLAVDRPAPPAFDAVSPTGAAADPLVDTLRRELDARAGAEADLRARLVDAETRLATRVLLDQRTSVLLGQLRAELGGLRQSLADERRLRTLAERHAAELEREVSGQRDRSREAHDAIGELRDALNRLRAPEDPEAGGASPPAPAPVPGSGQAAAGTSDPGPDDPSGPVEPARLNDALARLRETIAPHEPSTVPGGDEAPAAEMHAASGPALRTAFEGLVREHAQAAGRILLELLSLQGRAYPHPVAYDLVLGADRGCVWVTAADGRTEIELRSDPRPAEAVDFQVMAEPARIARMLTARGLRARFARRRSVTGRRERLAALGALLDTPLDLGALHRDGVRLDPAAALVLVAQMIDRRWTVRERFTLAHRDPEGETTYLEVADGQPLVVTSVAPQGRIATTIVCSADDLLTALAGEPGGGLSVEGDLGPLTAVRQWIKRAQSE